MTVAMVGYACRKVRAASAGALGIALSGCLSIGAGSSRSETAPAGISDGAVVTLAVAASDAVARTDSVLRAHGYEPRRERSLAIRTRPRTLGGDTTIVLLAEVAPYELSPGDIHSVVAITGTYSIPSLGVRHALIHAGPQVPPVLWNRVQAIGAALSPLPRVAP